MAGTGAPRTVRSCVWLAEIEQAINAESNGPRDPREEKYPEVSCDLGGRLA
jgi:hypothetical protein